MRHRAPEEPLFEFLSFGRLGPVRRDRLSPAHVQQVARTVTRTPEVMLKVLPSTGNSAAAVGRHLAYVGRQGEVELETDDGQHLRSREAAADLVEDWDLDLAEYQSGLGGGKGRPAPKLVHKLVFSMPAGTPATKVLAATQGFCREHWALKHRYAMALHTDEPHPHVHVIVKAVSEQGARLDVRKATLREWRQAFARHLRRVGVAANATPRVVRGETRPRKSDAVFRAARRGASTHMRDRLDAAGGSHRGLDQVEDLARRQVRETRQAVERGWLAASEVLERQGQTALARQTRAFVRDLPPARTEREWLKAELEQRRTRRAPDLERSR